MTVFYHHPILSLLLLTFKTHLKDGQHSEVNKVNELSHSKEAPGAECLQTVLTKKGRWAQYHILLRTG